MDQVVFSDGLWPKQRSETQADGLGSLIRSLTLVSADGKKRVEVQKDGAPVKGAIPTASRLVIKLLVAAWNSGPTTQKGRAYLESVALNQDMLKRILANAEKHGLAAVEVEWQKDKLFTNLSDLAAWAVSSLKLLESTSKRWPGQKMVLEAKPEADQKEEVALEL